MNFPVSSGQRHALDVTTIISNRLVAMEKLQENPFNLEAAEMIYSSQRKMSTWLSSQHNASNLAGNIEVSDLKSNKLNGINIWARRDHFTSTKPLTEGRGMYLLQKLGWKPGEGLGRKKNGSLQPLLLDVKLDKRGLIAKEECNRKVIHVEKQRKTPIQTKLPKKKAEQRHPVSLLNELTLKRKWMPPSYIPIDESGPSHCRMFLYSVQVNGQTFRADKACSTKKDAKMLAAKRCLQQFGILPAVKH